MENPTNLADLLKQAADFYDRGDFIEAGRVYERAVGIDSKNADAYNGWGVSLYAQKSYELAIEKYQKAIEINPKYVDAYNNWGNILYSQKSYEGAIEKYQKAIEINPQSAHAYYNWAGALAYQGRYEEAMEQYKKAVKAVEAVAQNPDFVLAAYAIHNNAYYLWKLGRYQEGKKVWEEACQTYERTKQSAEKERNSEHFYHYGMIRFDIFGELDEAEEIFQEGLVVDRDHAGILIGLVELYLERKDLYDKEKSGEENARARSEACWKAQECYRKARRLLEQHPERDTASLLQLSELLLLMEEYDEAERHLKQALLKDKESATVYAKLGVVYARKKDFKKAARFFEDALRKDPDDLAVWSNLAEVYLKLKQTDKAEGEYKKILRITPAHLDSQIGLGEVCSAMGDSGDEDRYDEAIGYFTESIRLADTKAGSKRLRSKELAAVYYSRGYARVKLYEVSKLMRDETLLSSARGDFEKCVELDPDHQKGKRAEEKLKKRLSHFSPQRFAEKGGPWLILVPSFFILIIGQSSFFFKKPETGIGVGSYLTLTFGSLIFMVVGLYLPQLLKLKVAGIELEKSPVDQITTSSPLGISK